MYVFSVFFFFLLLRVHCNPQLEDTLVASHSDDPMVSSVRDSSLLQVGDKLVAMDSGGVSDMDAATFFNDPLNFAEPDGDSPNSTAPGELDGDPPNMPS